MIVQKDLDPKLRHRIFSQKALLKFKSFETKTLKKYLKLLHRKFRNILKFRKNLSGSDIDLLKFRQIFTEFKFISEFRV